MNKNKLIKTSKFLSLVLRHDPSKASISLDDDGWTEVNFLCKQLNITRQELDEVVRDNDKKRFEYNDGETMIRAKWGHSIDNSPTFKAQKPPPTLYHGTATRSIDSIKKSGLVKGQRNHVHLSVDEKTAVQVGKRHGSPIILVINSGEMEKDGHSFYVASNNIWLTDNVPIKYITFPQSCTPSEVNAISFLEL
jgi:putative RNA 2'-phosphotransferase